MTRIRQRQQSGDESGAELIEFAIVVVLLITLIYGLLSYGLVFLVKTSTAQAADDASRAALATYNYDISIGDSTATAQTAATATAQATVNKDLSWLRGSISCGSSAPSSSVPVECATSFPTGSSCGGNTCFAVTVGYDYSDHPLVPELLFGVATPSTLTSTGTVLLTSAQT